MPEVTSTDVGQHWLNNYIRPLKAGPDKRISGDMDRLHNDINDVRLSGFPSLLYPGAVRPVRCVGDYIHRNDKVEVLVPVKHGERTGYLRFSAQAKIISDSKIRTRVAEATTYFSNYFDSPDDPKYALLHLIPDKAEYLKPDQMYPEPINL